MGLQMQIVACTMISDFDTVACILLQVGCKFKWETKQVATAAQTELCSFDDVIMICVQWPTQLLKQDTKTTFVCKSFSSLHQRTSV